MKVSGFLYPWLHKEVKNIIGTNQPACAAWHRNPGKQKGPRLGSGGPFGSLAESRIT
jgi:hypothetical protein